MRYIDVHAHMVARTTDDDERMALTGCVALTEPAFWPGWDRGSADGFDHYFRVLTTFEPARAARYGIRHYAWLCLNPQEGEDRALARAVLRRIPQGSHGRAVDDPARGPVFISGEPDVLDGGFAGGVDATEVKKLMLAHVFGGGRHTPPVVPVGPL